MGTVQKDSVVQNVLKNLCCSYGWSYGAFWSHGQPNSMLLTLQDAYFEENFGSLIDNLLLQVPVGGGIIGQVAYTNKHMWMSSEDQYKEQNLLGSIWEMFSDDNEIRSQFSSGMKTIAVIPVEPQGVVQFGSSVKIPERMDFVNQTKRMFQEIVNGGGSDITSLTSFNGQNCHQNEAFLASLISSEESCFTNCDGNSSRPNSSSIVFDELADFGIPNEFDFNVSQWFPALDPIINYDGKHEFLTISGSDVNMSGNSSDLRDILAPIISQNRSGLHSYCHVDHTAINPKEKLFSKLGIEELLDGAVSSISNAGSSSCIDGQVFVKRRKTGNSMWGVSQPALHTIDGYSMSGSSGVLQAEKQVVPPKPTKKKAKPGTRPRPKDRQQILDRMAELRQLIPNGEKMSIDGLLDRTIKHMIFLQSVTKHADKINQAEKRKQHKGVDSNDSSTNGVTWGCEIGNQMMVCPLMVEDLDEHGQMLIEMLCEEKEEGFFLEIVNIIRHFGLIILKGVMEAHGGYIWAHFIVEPEVNRVVTRHDIFTGLVRFIQTVSGVDKRCTSSGNSPLVLHQDGLQNLVNLADMQFCVDL